MPITEDVIMHRRTNQATAWKRVIRYGLLLVMAAAVGRCAGQTLDFTSPFSQVQSWEDSTMTVYNVGIQVRITTDSVMFDYPKGSLLHAHLPIQRREKRDGKILLVIPFGIVYVEQKPPGWMVTWVRKSSIWYFLSNRPDYFNVKY